jgi:hypothetical protein
MNAIFIFSTPWAFDPDQRIPEVRAAAPPMTPLMPNASIGLTAAIAHSVSSDL